MWSSRFVRAGMLAAVVCATSIPLLPTTAGAQEWGGLTPGEGAPGTSVTISGNLIGCYASGPGLESSTWGLPDRVALYFDNEVRDSEQTAAFTADLAADPNEVLRLEEVASYSFGEAGWELTFTVPDVRPGPHLVVLSFQPICNYRSVEAPDGYTHDFANVVLSFCITDDGVCPSASSLPPSGDDLGGGTRGMRTGTGSVDVLGNEIRTNVLVGSIAVIGIIAVLGAVAVAAASAAAAGSAALPAAAAVPALPAAVAAAAAPVVAAGSTTIAGTSWTIGTLTAVASPTAAGLSYELIAIRTALFAADAGIADAAQIALLARFGLLVP
jgi:hypothetical protein